MDVIARPTTQSTMNTLEGLTKKLAEFSVGLELKAIPATARDNAKISILDCLGVAVLATRQEIGERLMTYAKKSAAAGTCTIWGTDVSSSEKDAAFLNGMLAHGLDYDDRNHASTYSLAVALATAETVDTSGAATLEAFIVSREVRAALDSIFAKRSSGIGPGAKGWHSNGILGPIASACAASKIFGFDVQQTTTAIGLAAGSCGALTRDGGTMAKPFRVGHAASTGVMCAQLAGAGFTSDETALEGRYGLLEALGPLPEDILTSLGNSLGREYDLEKAIRVKPFASCTASHSGVEAMLRLVETHSISPADVDVIEADIKPYPLVRAIPKRGFEGRFSLPFCLAHTLVYHRLRPDDFTDDRLREPLMIELIGAVRHVPDCQSVSVILKSGERFNEMVKSPSDLKGWNQTAAKFLESVAGILPHNQQQRVLESVERLQDIVSIRTLSDGLRAPVS